MGLISDALKRAEQERIKKAQGAPAGGAEGPDAARQQAPADVAPVAPDDLVDVPPGLHAALSAGGSASIATPEWNPQPQAGISAFNMHESVVAFHDKASEISEEYRY